LIKISQLLFTLVLVDGIVSIFAYPIDKDVPPEKDLKNFDDSDEV